MHIVCFYWLQQKWVFPQTAGSWAAHTTLLSRTVFLPPSLQTSLRHLQSCCIYPTFQSSCLPSISSFLLPPVCLFSLDQTHWTSYVFSSCLRSTDWLSAVNPAVVPWAAEPASCVCVFMFEDESLTIICRAWKNLINSKSVFHFGRHKTWWSPSAGCSP